MKGFAVLLIVLLGCVGLSSPAFAAEIKGYGNSSSNQDIYVTLDPSEQIASVVVIGGESGDGGSSTPYVVRNKHVAADITVVGVGTVQIMYNGAVLWSVDKTVADLTVFRAEFDLPNGVGLYDLIVELFDGAVVAASADFYVDWRAANIVPWQPDDAPTVPGTGFYMYFGGTAVAVSDLMFWVVLAVGLGFGGWLIIHHRYDEREKRNGK
ncbi:hypothetical protein FWF74_02720 [Candidatus Saccharibacteria bacterium]|nr:hypothetical protein [Candidatus Saccharibacteria bacterium]MCL1963415.1 hypothetical protein [Candidatus Saccharibacteria bacterium]